MRKALMTALAVGLVITGLTGCGSGSTTVISQTTTTTTTEAGTAGNPGNQTSNGVQESSTTTTQAATTTQEPPQKPPDVTGLTLPTAKKQLSAAGFKADVSNTDTTFGILVPQNYTVCKQSAPRGNIVPILAQKYGC
jgi:cytoskeletal protein RodZ